MYTYMKCTRNGQSSYSKHIGMTLQTITSLIEGLGATSVEQITEQVYLDGVAALV